MKKSEGKKIDAEKRMFLDKKQRTEILGFDTMHIHGRARPKVLLERKICKYSKQFVCWANTGLINPI